MKASEIIRDTRNVLFERGWRRCGSPNLEGALCLEQALCVAAGARASMGRTARAAVGPAADYVSAAVGEEMLWAWNDDPFRTFDDIIDALDRAEKRAEQREAIA